jgi:hypothetical protein
MSLLRCTTVSQSKASQDTAIEKGHPSRGRGTSLIQPDTTESRTVAPTLEAL